IADGDATPSGTDGTDFGTVLQGTTVDRVVTVSNTGTAALTSSGVTLPSGFSLVEGLSASIAAGVSDTFTVRLDGTALGTQSGQISFATNDGDENPFNFSIAGTVNAVPVPEIAVSGLAVNITDGDATPGSADATDFGSVLQGTTVDHVFTVSDLGTAALTTSGLTLPAGFSLVEGLSASIAAGGSDTFTVRLDTSTTGTKTGQISFTTNDGDENTFNYSIAGTVTAPEIAVSGLAVTIADGDATPSGTDGTDFGTVLQGATVDRVFTVGNTGTAALTTSGLTLPVGFSLVEGLSASIAAGGSDSFTVRLDSSIAGTKSGQISFGTNDGDENPFNFSIAGTVTAPEIAVSGLAVDIADGDATPSSTDGTDFGSVLQGTTVDRVFTVSNTGTAALTTSGLTLPSGFSLVEGLSASIAAGGSDTFTVRLDGTTLGTSSGQISFATNDGDENPFNYSIAGTVTAPEIAVSGLAVNIADGDATPSS